MNTKRVEHYPMSPRYLDEAFTMVNYMSMFGSLGGNKEHRVNKRHRKRKGRHAQGLGRSPGNKGGNGHNTIYVFKYNSPLSYDNYTAPSLRRSILH